MHVLSTINAEWFRIPLGTSLQSFSSGTAPPTMMLSRRFAVKLLIALSNIDWKLSGPSFSFSSLQQEDLSTVSPVFFTDFYFYVAKFTEATMTKT